MELPSTSSSSALPSSDISSSSSRPSCSTKTAKEKAISSLARKMQMKELLDTGRQLENHMDQQTIAETLEVIESLIVRANSIQEHVSIEDRAEHTTEIVMDVQVLKMNHDLLSRVLKKNQVFDFSLLRVAVEKIIYKDDEVNWDNLAGIACGVARTVCVKPTMLGVVNVEVTEQVVKEKKRAKRQLLDKEVRPETLSKMESKNKGHEKVRFIQKQLGAYYIANNRKPFPFYKVVIDPKDFMKSVQNIFVLSFLARDNVIGIEEGVNGHPYVRFLTKAERERSHVETSQSICSLNHATWKKLIEFYEIETPILDIDAGEERDSDDSD